jgi:hypothetical protein
LAFSWIYFFDFVITLKSATPTAAPIICAAINARIELAEIPAGEVVKTRPIVTAGLANVEEAVKK